MLGWPTIPYTANPERVFVPRNISNSTAARNKIKLQVISLYFQGQAFSDPVAFAARCLLIPEVEINMAVSKDEVTSRVVTIAPVNKVPTVNL